MRKIIVSEFLTLDGVMQAPGDPNEDRSGGFDQGGWQLAYFDDIFGQAMTDSFAQTGAMLLGRRTYDIFNAYWPKRPADDPIAPFMNETPKYVVSTSLSEPLEWQNSTLIKGDVPAELAKLKEGDGKDIVVIGSGELAQTLIANDLVDEYVLMIHPLILGNGKRLFRDETKPIKLHLTDSKTTTKGVLLNTYRPAAEAGEQVAVPVGEEATSKAS
jgi:dihydrofolate reductase